MVKKKQKNETQDEKFTLVELVMSSDIPRPSLIMDLHRAGLLEQYHEELDAYGRLDIEPSITKAEFNKIIGE